MTGWRPQRAQWTRAAALCAVALAAALPLRPEEISEERLQATMLVRVLKFVEWPRPDETGEFRVCILGGPRFEKFAAEAAREDTWHGRPIAVTGIGRLAGAAGCHATFVAAASDRDIDTLIARTEGPMLTVARREGFARRGGMVNFIRDRGRIGFEVNPGAGERVGIRFSSKLLRLARVVSTGEVN